MRPEVSTAMAVVGRGLQLRARRGLPELLGDAVSYPKAASTITGIQQGFDQVGLASPRY